jgi:hypothetical protein
MFAFMGWQCSGVSKGANLMRHGNAAIKASNKKANGTAMPTIRFIFQ